MMQCEFKNCKQEAFTCGNVICYTEDGDFDTICLCKKHALMLVPKKLRDYAESKEYPHWLESKIPPEEQIRRLQQMIDIIKSHSKTLMPSADGDIIAVSEKTATVDNNLKWCGQSRNCIHSAKLNLTTKKERN